MSNTFDIIREASRESGFGARLWVFGNWGWVIGQNETRSPQAPSPWFPIPTDLVKYGIIAVVVVLLLYVLLKILRRRKGRLPPRVPELAIDVGTLSQEGPPPSGPVLEFYNLPVRLAAVVLAPTGRVADLPTLEKIPELVDHAVPGLAQIVAAQTPLIRRWPAQLSGEGFAHMFFAHVRLPGDRGKGSPWCSAAGRFKIGKKAFMAGLVMRAASDNNFGQTIIAKEHEWLGVLRVRSG